MLLTDRPGNDFESFLQTLDLLNLVIYSETKTL
jgi:hypothetical protein